MLRKFNSLKNIQAMYHTDQLHQSYYQTLNYHETKSETETLSRRILSAEKLNIQKLESRIHIKMQNLR